ncbi:MAG: hypothetical protein Q8L84_04885 [Hyphomonas sp.]|nr:hypothetical protein [Hyphomonas sp.]
MQFTAAHLDEILTFNWPVAARLVAWARALAGLAAATLPQHTLLEARRILRPAESFIRRLIVIMACRIDIPQPLSSRTKAAQRPADPGPSLPHTQSPGHLGCAEPISFSTEPFPKIAPFAYPGIWSPGMVRYTPPTPEELAAAPLPATHFFARLARLEAALAAPDAAAKRLALWMARRRAAEKQRLKPVRTMPIRPWGLMPGRGSGVLDNLTKDRLKYTACAAQAALAGAWNSS